MFILYIEGLYAPLTIFKVFIGMLIVGEFGEKVWVVW